MSLTRLRIKSKRIGERQIFSLFLGLEPLFAGEPIREWHQPRKDPPDVLCVTRSGRRLGVELVGWLDKTQTGSSISQNRVREAFQAVVGRRANRTNNVGLVWLTPRRGVRGVPAGDVLPFRRALFRLITDTDRKWPDERFWHHAHGAFRRDVADFPPLDRYLECVQCLPARTMTRPWPAGISWVTLPEEGEVFSEKDMLPSLYGVLDSKRDKSAYSQLTIELDLVVHYDAALLHNTPVFTPWFSFEDAASHAREYLRDNPGPFRRIFLLKALRPGEAAIRIYP